MTKKLIWFNFVTFTDKFLYVIDLWLAFAK